MASLRSHHWTNHGTAYRDNPSQHILAQFLCHPWQLFHPTYIIYTQNSISCFRFWIPEGLSQMLGLKAWIKQKTETNNLKKKNISYHPSHLRMFLLVWGLIFAWVLVFFWWSAAAAIFLSAFVPRLLTDSPPFCTWEA